MELRVEDNSIILIKEGKAFPLNADIDYHHIIEEKNGYKVFFNGDKTEGTITLEKDSIVLTVSKPVKCLPYPALSAKDRIFITVGEGIALDVSEDYPFIEENFESRFCSQKGTMSFTAFQINCSYMICIADNAMYSGYRIFRSENGLLHSSLINYANTPCKFMYYICGSIAEACKIYRRLKSDNYLSLRQKAEKTAEIDEMIGTANFWVWNRSYEDFLYSPCESKADPFSANGILKIAGKLKEEGIRKAIFGIFFENDYCVCESLRKKYGYLTAKYDNYNDVPPSDMGNYIPERRIKECDYSRRRKKDFPDGITVMKDNTLAKAWELVGFDGKKHPQNSLCAAVAAERMKEEIPDEIKKAPECKLRFIDVYGVSISECFSEKHPLTFERAVTIKNSAYNSITEMGLVPGTEDGFDMICSSVVYSEGMMSPCLLRYNPPECGRNKARPLGKEAAEYLKKYMLNFRCRVPLWELVWHDSVISFPYWGDSLNCCDSLMNERILFHCLYGCPPLFSFFEDDFNGLQTMIVNASKQIASVTEKVGYLEMTDFEYLNEAMTVQKTVFGNRYSVIANFGDESFIYGGCLIKSKSFIFEKYIGK